MNKEDGVDELEVGDLLVVPHFVMQSDRDFPTPDPERMSWIYKARGLDGPQPPQFVARSQNGQHAITTGSTGIELTYQEGINEPLEISFPTTNPLEPPAYLETLVCDCGAGPDRSAFNASRSLPFVSQPPKTRSHGWATAFKECRHTDEVIRHGIDGAFLRGSSGDTASLVAIQVEWSTNTWAFIQVEHDGASSPVRRAKLVVAGRTIDLGFFGALEGRRVIRSLLVNLLADLDEQPEEWKCHNPYHGPTSYAGSHPAWTKKGLIPMKEMRLRKDRSLRAADILMGLTRLSCYSCWEQSNLPS